MEQDDGQEFDPTEEQRFSEDQETQSLQSFSDWLFELLASSTRAAYEAKLGKKLS